MVNRKRQEFVPLIGIVDVLTKPIGGACAVATLVVVCLVLASASAAHATSYTWFGGAGDWFTASNWSPPTGPPGPGDDVVINSGPCLLDAPGVIVDDFTMTGGTLDGTGTLHVQGVLSWSEGTMAGSGTTNANGPLALGTGAMRLYRRLNTNNASATWAGGSLLLGGSNGELRIGAITTFDLQGGGSFIRDSGPAMVNNSGTIKKTAGSATTIRDDVQFNNGGTVDVQSGTLIVRGTGVHSGSFDATGATLEFRAGVNQFTGAASVTGTVLVDGATAGIYFASTSATLGDLTVINSAKLYVSTLSASTAASLSLSQNGVLDGSGTLNVTGPLTWGSGTMIGGGVTNADGGLTFTVTGGGRTLARTLNLNSASSWTSSGTMGMGAAGVAGTLNIAAGATFEVLNAMTIQAGATTPGVVNNAGTLQKASAPLTIGTYVSFNNSGVVSVNAGSLTLQGPYTQTAGATRLNGGTISSATTMNILGGTLEGAGTLTATVNNSGGQVAPGLSAGQLNETGAYTQGASGAYNVEIGGLTAGTEFDQLAISGAANLDGALNVSLIDGFEPSFGDTFEIMTFGSRTGDFSSMTGAQIGNGLMFQRAMFGTRVVLQVVVAPTPTLTATPTKTATPTPTVTPISTQTATPPSTSTATPTATATPLAMSTPTVTSTPAATADPTPSPTSTLPACDAVPIVGCRTPAAPQKALLFLKDKPDDDKDQLIWKWIKGAATAKADFGSPTTVTDYQLCIYDGTLNVIVDAAIPAGGQCNAANPRDCWQEKATGFSYKNKDTTPKGVAQLLLKEGLVDGKSMIVLKAKGAALDDPMFPLSQPLTVQLRNSDGVCWEAVYSAPALSNTAGPPAQFKDKAD